MYDPRKLFSCAIVSSLMLVPNMSAAERPKEDPLDYHLIQRLSTNKVINALAWNRDGSRMAALSDFGGTITVWKTDDWSVVHTIHRYGGAYAFNSFDYLSDGNLLLSAPIGKSPFPPYEYTEQYAFEVINGGTGKHISYIENQTKENFRKISDTFAISAGGDLVAGVPTGSFKKVFVFRTKDWTILSQNSLSGDATKQRGIASSLAFSSDDNRLAIGRSGGQLEVYDLKTSYFVFSKQIFDQRYSPNSLKFDLAGKFLAVGARQDFGQADRHQKLAILKVDDWTPVFLKDEISSNISDMSWNRAGVLAIGSAGRLTIINCETKASNELRRGSEREAFYSVKFSSDSRLAAAVGSAVLVFRLGSHL